MKKSFFKAVTSVLANTEKDDECIKQLNLNFKKLSESFSIPSTIKNSIDLLEDMIFRIDTLGETKFEKQFGIKVTMELRNRIIKIIEKMREKNPFVSISSKEANLLINLSHALESDNKELGHTILNQLSDEIEMLENNILNQDTRNKNSYVIAAVGLILTIYFGILSLIK